MLRSEEEWVHKGMAAEMRRSRKRVPRFSAWRRRRGRGFATPRRNPNPLQPRGEDATPHRSASSPQLEAVQCCNAATMWHASHSVASLSRGKGDTMWQRCNDTKRLCPRWRNASRLLQLGAGTVRGIRASRVREDVEVAMRREEDAKLWRCDEAAKVLVVQPYRAPMPSASRAPPSPHAPAVPSGPAPPPHTTTPLLQYNNTTTPKGPLPPTCTPPVGDGWGINERLRIAGTAHGALCRVSPSSPRLSAALQQRTCEACCVAPAKPVASHLCKPRATSHVWNAN
jgi:hypothetical protein